MAADINKLKYIIYLYNEFRLKKNMKNDFFSVLITV